MCIAGLIQIMRVVTCGWSLIDHFWTHRLKKHAGIGPNNVVRLPQQVENLKCLLILKQRPMLHPGRRSRRGGGGAEGRRAARLGGGVFRSFGYIKRQIPLYEVLGEEGLSLIEANCDTVSAGSRHRLS